MVCTTAYDKVFEFARSVGFLWEEEIFTRPVTQEQCDLLTHRLLRKVVWNGGEMLIEPSSDTVVAVRIRLAGESYYSVSTSINVAIAEACSKILQMVHKKDPTRLKFQ